MQIEQATYGEQLGGHSLLASSGDDAVSTGIIQRLDLPDTAPPGIEWSPFLRGFPYEDRYVLSRTFHDTSASRGGMVFSHALLVSLDEIVETPNIGPLLKVLATSNLQRPDPTTVNVVRAEGQIPHASDLIDTAEALGTKGRLPVVRLGHVGFDDLVVALWEHLLPEIRRDFAFRLSFDPRDLVETPRPALVCTPRGMAARWTKYPVIRSTVRREPGSLLGALLSGHRKAVPLIEFMRHMGIKPATFSVLRLVDEAYRLDLGDPTFERHVGAMRLIGKLSPDADVGNERKNVLVLRLCELVLQARAGEVLRLRNLELSGFPAPDRVWNALERWVAENTYPPDQDVEMLSVLEDATAGNQALQEWRAAILNGVAAAIRSDRSSFPKAFWRWIEFRLEVVLVVFRHVPDDVGVEERFAATTPREVHNVAAETLAARALSRGWICLHGAILSASCSALDAARRQVTIDTDLAFVEGLRWALRNATPQELVDCALEIEDPRIPRLAGEAVIRHPMLLDEVDLTAIRAQVVWREALAIDPESWRLPHDPEATFHSILDRLLDAREVDTSLIERLSNSPVSDIGTYPRRPEIWSRLRGVTRHNILAATAEGWLESTARGRVSFLPEGILQTAIIEGDRLRNTLDQMIPTRVGVAVRIVSALNRCDQQRFLHFLRELTTRTKSIAVSDAESIGRLVLERRWKDVAVDLAGQYRTGRRDFEPALRSCFCMLDLWDRFSLGVVPLSDSEKWEVLQELATELYPIGPNDLELWGRAGGDGADLSVVGDGRTQWRRAVWAIRSGRGPTASALLYAMKEDYPNNQRIRRLGEDQVFGARVTDGLGGA